MSPVFPNPDDLKVDAGPCFVMLPRLLTSREVAKWLGIHPCTVIRWRRPGIEGGPPFIKVSDKLRGGVRYSALDLVKWLEARRRTEK